MASNSQLWDAEAEDKIPSSLLPTAPHYTFFVVAQELSKLPLPTYCKDVLRELENVPGQFWDQTPLAKELVARSRWPQQLEAATLATVFHRLGR